MRISLPVWSQPGYELQLLQIKKLSWKASRNEEDCRVLTPRFYVSTSKSIIKALINMHSFEIQLSPIG
ncbi:TPA: hypothetical protein HHH24_005316 [Escherichia coli]|nr:hypothetical protein [Escherichia coli]HAH1292842.1 hypothetical protein [Escherichia coli]